MTYAYVTEPAYSEDPKSHQTRVREIDLILARVGDKAAVSQQEQVSSMGLASLFGMEMGGELR